MTQVLIDAAYEFAAMAHLGQTRKYTGDPYIVHPVAVAAMVKEKGGTSEMVAAALLHDTVEDCDVTIDRIDELFGPVVALYVLELTDVYTSERFPQLNRATRKTMEANRMAHVSDEAKQIKLCDMIDNTSTIVEHDPGFAKVYLAEKAYLYSQMGF